MLNDRCIIVSDPDYTTVLFINQENEVEFAEFSRKQMKEISSNEMWEKRRETNKFKGQGDMVDNLEVFVDCPEQLPNEEAKK